MAAETSSNVGKWVVGILALGVTAFVIGYAIKKGTQSAA
jgi:hypothetical protein